MRVEIDAGFCNHGGPNESGDIPQPHRGPAPTTVTHADMPHLAAARAHGE